MSTELVINLGWGLFIRVIYKILFTKKTEHSLTKLSDPMVP